MKQHLVFPLVPAACAYTKLGDYFGKLRKSQMLVLQVQGDFGGSLEVRTVAKNKSQRLQSKMGNPKR